MDTALHRVVKILKVNGRALVWLAEESGVPYSRLYRLKRGEYDDLRASEARAIARALRVPEDILFEGVSVQPDDPAANVMGRRVYARKARRPALVRRECVA